MLNLSAGGGVGLMGEGQSGVVSVGGIGGGGSGGQDGFADTGETSGGYYGGGGYYAGNGGKGGVRIIWPGDVRYFPSTRTADE